MRDIGFVMILTYIFSLAYIATINNRGIYDNYDVKLLKRKDMKVKEAIQGINNPVMYNFLIVAMMQFVIDQERSMGTIRKLTITNANNMRNTDIEAIGNNRRVSIGMSNIINNVKNSEDSKRIQADILEMLNYYLYVMNGNTNFTKSARVIKNKFITSVVGAI